MSGTIKLTVNKKGEVHREADNKLVATIQEDGTPKFANAAYAKGEYREAIIKASEGFEPSTEEDDPVEPEVDEIEVADPRVGSEAPPRCPSLGAFSAAHINYDHANMSDEEFGFKYKESAECQLEFIAYRPHLFSDKEALEERLGNLNK